MAVIETLPSASYLSDRDVREAFVAPRPEAVSSLTTFGFFARSEARPMVLVEATAPPQWLRSVVDQIRETVVTQHARGEALADATVIKKALVFLTSALNEDTAPPFVVGLDDGGLQLEWHRGGMDVEVRVPREGASMLMYEEVQGEGEWEGPLDFGRELFRQILERLSVQGLGQAA